MMANSGSGSTNFVKVAAGGAISVKQPVTAAQGGVGIPVLTPPPQITMENTGTGTKVYRGNVGTLYQFKSIIGQNSILVTSDDNNIYISSVDSGGGGVSVGYLPLAGGTLTGPLTLPSDPTLALQAATKEYVDSVAGSATITFGTTSGTVAQGNDSRFAANAAAAATANTAAVNALARSNHTGTQLAATISDLATTVKAYTLDSFAAPIASLALNSQRISGLANPVNPQDAVTLSYLTSQVQSAAAGISSKPPVAVVALSNVATLSGTTATIDGVTVTNGMRVLLVGQTTASQNGVYVVASGSWARSTFDTQDELTTGAMWLVTQGTSYTGTQWRLSTIGTIIVDTTSIVIVQFSATVPYTFTNGVTLTGNSITGMVHASNGVKLDNAGFYADMTILAPLASPTFTGTPLAPTPTAGDSSTKLATTAFVSAAVTAGSVTAFNTRTGAVTLTSNDVTTALNFTPYNATNPAVYQTAAQVGTLITAATASLAPLASPVFSAGLFQNSTGISASTIDLRSASFFSKTITAATTFAITNVPSSGIAASFILELTNGAAFTVTWWPNVRWAGGVAPTLSTTGVDVLGFYTHDGGTNWRGILMAKNSS